ncbi:MAG: DUF302 domain-containing protein [Pseudomonadota bacterium]
MKMLAMLFALLVPAAFAAEPAQESGPAAASTPAPEGGWIAPQQTPYGPVIIQQGMMPPQRDYQMNRVIPPEEKKRYMQMAMPMMANMMQLDAREAMSYMVVKYQAKPGVTFDEAVQSLKLRANQLNFKFVGENLMWKDFRAVLGDNSAPRVEVFSFCDIAIGRELLKLVPEMVVFLPCRIAVMEDANRNIWILTLDWDFTWLDQAGESLGITPELRQGIADIRAKMDEMMRAAANGDI